MKQNKRPPHPGAVLVTGGAGFIGSHFVEHLLHEGHEVVVLDSLTYAGDRANLPEKLYPNLLHFMHGDIRDTPLVHDLLSKYSVRWLVNFAAETHVDRSIESSGTFLETNVMGTHSLLKASLDHWTRLDTIEKASFRYLQVSTDEVYGDLSDHDPRFVETSSIRPSSPYAASKAAADLLVQSWFRTFEFPTLVTRCSNNYGTRQFPEKLIPLMISRATEGLKLPVYGTGLNIRDWIHVSDHCSGLYSALLLGRVGQTYCFGGDSERRNIELVNQICEILDQLAPRHDGRPHANRIESVTDRQGHDFRYAIDSSKARAELDFRCRFAFSEGLRSTIEWYLSRTRRKAA